MLTSTDVINYVFSVAVTYKWVQSVGLKLRVCFGSLHFTVSFKLKMELVDSGWSHANV